MMLSIAKRASALTRGTPFGARSFSSAKRKIGFIGLGNMGGHMARNLLKAGHSLVVFDVSSQAVESLKSSGATSAATPRELASQVDMVISMLPSSPHVRDVYLSDKGVLAGARAGTFLIDSSTIDPHTAKSVAQSAKDKSMTMIDAPVSGGVGGAEAGTLTFMVGGSQAAFETAKPVLANMGKNIVYCGAEGMGQAAKIANNLVLAISMIGVSEGMNLGVKLGMDPKVLAGIFNTSSGRCWSSDTYNPCPGVMPNVPASRGYTGGFGVDLMKKDLGLAVQAADQAKANLPMGSVAHQLYSLLSSHGSGQKDFSSIYEWLSGQQKK